MASLSVRNLDDTVYEQLRIRAAKQGLPVEDVVHQILIQAIKTPERISDVFRKHFAPQNGVDLVTPLS